MVDATLFVAIAIGCVIALLLLTVMFVYCLKRHHDKQQNRELHDRRAREERHRRHLMRAQVVQPPPYDPQRRNVLTMVQEPVPFSPPPEYKEMATPLPPRDGQDGVIVGIGGMTGYDVHSSPRARNVAPVNTSYHNNNNNDNNNNQLRQQPHQQSQRIPTTIQRNNYNNNVHSRNNINNNITRAGNANQRTTVAAPVDVHDSAARSSGQPNGHSQRGDVRHNPQHLQHPPRHDPPSYSSLQRHRTVVDNADSHSNVSTISINSNNNNNNSNGNNNNSNNNSSNNNSYSNRPAHNDNNNNSNNNSISNNNSYNNRPAQHNNIPNRQASSRPNDANTNRDEARTTVARTTGNGASTSSSATNRGRVMTSRPLSSGLNTMPEIEDLSLI